MVALTNQRKKEVIEQTITFFVAVFFITTILHSFGMSWGILSVPVSLSKFLIVLSVIFSCYKFSFFIVKVITKVTFQER